VSSSDFPKTTEQQLREMNDAFVSSVRQHELIEQALKAEDALRKTGERYRAVIENVRDYAILTTARDGRVQTWNSGAEIIFGYSAAEMVGRDASILFTPEDRAAGIHAGELATAARDGRVSHDRWHLRKSGERFWASGVTHAEGNSDGQVTDFTTILRDETARKMLEEQLHSLNEALEQRVKERTREMLVYQNQLRSLVAELNRTEQRERERVAAELHDNLAQLLVLSKMKVSVIEASASPASAVAREAGEVKNLLGECVVFTRALMADLRPEILNDSDLVSALGWVAQRMHRHGLRVRVEDDGQSKPLDQEVLVLLFQSVRELLFNVVKHARTDEAAVTLERVRGTVRITVSDSGVGFDASGRTVIPSPQGGFGLFSIRERIDLLGGRLELKSSPGSGAAAVLTAPLRLGSGQEVVSDPGDALANSSGKIRVLLADDHRGAREGLKNLINGHPNMVVVAEASDGHAAVELSRALRPDVVLMDVSMPNQNGVEATRLIVTDVPQVKVIGLSVRDDHRIAATMGDAGASAYFAKGGEVDELFRMIRQVVARPALEDA
jgi:PAS domain S-box-containing protein